MIKMCFGEILISWSPLEVLLRKSLIFMPVGLKLLASSNGLFLQETCQKCYQYLCKTHIGQGCLHVISRTLPEDWLSRISESFTQLNSKEHTLILTGWQGKVILYTNSSWCSGSKMKHQSPACCRLEMCWPKGISPGFTCFPMLPFATPGSRHESTRTLHAFHHHLCLHTPRTLWILPLTDHTCHFTHLPTSPSRSGCFFLPSCSSTNRNLSYGCD